MNGPKRFVRCFFALVLALIIPRLGLSDDTQSRAASLLQKIVTTGTFDGPIPSFSAFAAFGKGLMMSPVRGEECHAFRVAKQPLRLYLRIAEDKYLGENIDGVMWFKCEPDAKGRETKLELNYPLSFFGLTVGASEE